VPKATPVQLTDVAAAAEDVTDRPGKWRKFARRAEPSARAAAVVLLVAGLFCGAIWLGHRQYAQSEVAVGRPGGGGTGPDLPGNSPQPPPIEAPRGYDPGQVHGELVDAPRPRSWAWVYVPACLLLLLGGVAASLRPNVVIPDTEQFTKAINLWSPLLFTGRMTTPRTVKRFINRVRYLAMRQRPPEPFRNALQRLGHLIRRSTDAFTAGTTAGTKNQATLPRYIREETLVALSAVRYHADRSLDDEGKLADAIKSLKKELAKEPDPQHEASRSPQQVELEKELAKLRAYVDELGDLHELRQALPRFLDISKGVSVN